MSGRTEQDQSDKRQARWMRQYRAKLAEHVKEIDGVRISTHPDCPHGTRDGYDLYSCRCVGKCSEHSAADRVSVSRARRLTAAAEAVLHAHGVPEGEPQQAMAAELIEIWRGSRGRNRIHKLAVHISRSPHGLTGQHANVVAEEMTAKLRSTRSQPAASHAEQSAHERDG